jgi:hypothetical protein
MSPERNGDVGAPYQHIPNVPPRTKVAAARRLCLHRNEAKESVEPYFRHARVLVSDLMSCGELISENGSFARVLEGLSPEFSTMVETIVFQIAADPQQWSWDRVVCFCIEAEARLARKAATRRDEGGAALYNQAVGRKARNAGKGAKGNGHRSEQQQETRSCYFCSKTGRLTRDCLKFQRAADKQGASVGAALVTCTQRVQRREGPC